VFVAVMAMRRFEKANAFSVVVLLIFVIVQHLHTQRLDWLAASTVSLCSGVWICSHSR
jgi:hypothetical protein